MPDIRIEKLGSAGDGIGRHDGKPVYVANSLPGELVQVDDNMPNPQLIEIIQTSPQRQMPPCPHFGTCGGCTFQHSSDQLILDWKQHEVEFAFSNAGLNVEVEPTFATPRAARRRVTFTAQRALDGGSHGQGIHFGYKERNSDTIVDIASCAILQPELEAEIPQMRDLCKTLLRGNEEIQVSVNLCDNGFDLDFHLHQPPNETMTAAFVRAMAKSPYLRGSIDGDIVIEKEKPLIRFGRAEVAIPPGGFLQAVAAAEVEMARLVCQHLDGHKRVVDLFSGSGTFALRLAERSRVHAVELEKAALAALQSAGHVEGLKSISVETRDLHELPLTLAELKPFDGLCLDPPRAGAEQQCRLIAQSNIRAVAYVSCNPTSLARDAAHLIEGGYKLEQVSPVDQFVYSPHIEVVALFSKKPSKAARSIFR
jgi:23S rRNA (uracil1939-C5)-methyltransferase